MPKIITADERKDIKLQIRISKLEKDKLEKVCKALNLTYSEVFFISLDNLSRYLEKMNINEN